MSRYLFGIFGCSVQTEPGTQEKVKGCRAHQGVFVGALRPPSLGPKKGLVSQARAPRSSAAYGADGLQTQTLNTKLRKPLKAEGL